MSKIYNKAALVKEVAEKLGFAQNSVAEVLDAVLDATVTHAQSGETVNFSGFGRFKVKTSAARTGRNPRTGEAVDIPAKDRLTFTPTRAKT